MIGSRIAHEEEIDELAKSLASKDYVQEKDVLIFHDVMHCKVLDYVDKPSVLYNHTASPRRMTFLFEDVVKQLNGISKMGTREMRESEIEKARELYQKPNVILSNSKFIQKQTKKFYGVDTKVVYPPVDFESFSSKSDLENEDFFVSVQRIDWTKNIDTQLKVFDKLPDEELKIIGGDGPYTDEVRVLADNRDNVEYLGWVEDEELVEYVSRAKGLIQTAMKEDFGLVPIEAMAAGTPPIVTNAGGYKETVHSDNLGVRVEKPYEYNFERAIKSFNPQDYNKNELQKEAKKYDEVDFSQQMQEAVSLAKEKHGG